MRTGSNRNTRQEELKVKFRNSKYLKEVWEIPYDNRGKRVSDEPNEGQPVTDFKDYFKSIEYSNACAIAKARLINISREAHQFRRRVYRYSLPESSVIYWEGNYAYLLDSVPPIAAEHYRIPLNQIPRVTREEAIKTCLSQPLEQYNFGDVPDWVKIMALRDTPLTVIPKYDDTHVRVICNGGKYIHGSMLCVKLDKNAVDDADFIANSALKSYARIVTPGLVKISAGEQVAFPAWFALPFWETKLSPQYNKVCCTNCRLAPVQRILIKFASISEF